MTYDLGQGWFANKNDNGSMTIRNPDLGHRIDLPMTSVATLKAALAAK